MPSREERQPGRRCAALTSNAWTAETARRRRSGKQDRHGWQLEARLPPDRHLLGRKIVAPILEGEIAHRALPVPNDTQLRVSRDRTPLGGGDDAEDILPR